MFDFKYFIIIRDVIKVLNIKLCKRKIGILIILPGYWERTKTIRRYRYFLKRYYQSWPKHVRIIAVFNKKSRCILGFQNVFNVILKAVRPRKKKSPDTRLDFRVALVAVVRKTTRVKHEKSYCITYIVQQKIVYNLKKKNTWNVIICLFIYFCSFIRPIKILLKKFNLFNLLKFVFKIFDRISNK